MSIAIYVTLEGEIPRTPSWFKAKKAGATPIKSTILARTEENLRMEVIRVDSEFVRIRLLVAGATPRIPGSANIDADIDVFVWRRPGLPAHYYVKGRHDGLSAYELYVNRERVAEYDPVVAADTPIALLKPMDRTMDLGWKVLPDLQAVIPV